MMEGINLYSIDYYDKTMFTGSYRGMCFRVKKETVPADVSGDMLVGESGDADISGGSEGDEAETVDVLRAIAWKGPYVLEKTKEEVFTRDFEFTDDGLAAANEWLEGVQKGSVEKND